jgi:hypothetical protein
MNPQKSPTPSAPAGDTGGGGISESGSTLTDVKNKVGETAKDAAAKVKSAASQTVAKAKDQAEQIVSDKKETAANRIGSYSSAIHESARSLEEQDPNIAWFTHRAANKMQDVADYVRTRDLSMLRDDAANLARRHPAAYFGGMFIAGLVLGNLVKSSQRKLGSSEGMSGEGLESGDQDRQLQESDVRRTNYEPGNLQF